MCVMITVEHGLLGGNVTNRLEAHPPVSLVVEQVDDEAVRVTRHRLVRSAACGTGVGRVVRYVHIDHVVDAYLTQRAR